MRARLIAIPALVAGLFFVSLLPARVQSNTAVFATLSSAQLSTLKTWLNANVPNQDDFQATNTINATASPDFWVWKSSVTKDELVNSTGPDGTTFAWTGAGFITRSAGEQAAWRELFSVGGTVDPSKSNVRQAFADIFSGGTAPAPANRTHLLAVARRKATVFERTLATGTGSTASPAVMGVEGPATMQNVVDARSLP
jgi:hypothetical protein